MYFFSPASDFCPNVLLVFIFMATKMLSQCSQDAVNVAL